MAVAVDTFIRANSPYQPLPRDLLPDWFDKEEAAERVAADLAIEAYLAGRIRQKKKLRTYYRDDDLMIETGPHSFANAKFLEPILKSLRMKLEGVTWH